MNDFLKTIVLILFINAIEITTDVHITNLIAYQQNVRLHT